MKERYISPLEELSDAKSNQGEKVTTSFNSLTITVEEYKNLITEAVSNRKDAERYSAEIWELRQKLKNAEDKITEVEVESKKLINEMAKLEVELANYKEVCKNVCS